MARLILLLAALCLIVGCQSAEVTTVWKTSEPLPPTLDKIVTIVANASPAERRAGEDELARQLRPGQGVAGYTLISDADLRDKEKVRQALQTGKADGALVLRLVAVDKNATYYPPTYYSSYPYYDVYGGPVTSSPGYTVTDTTIKTEISLYSVKGGNLLWAGAGSMTNPDNIRDLIDAMAKAAREEMTKQGVLR
jgi:hypothetical protein